MYFILDIACALVIIGILLKNLGTSFWAPLLRMIAVLVSAAIALTASAFLAPVLSNAFVQPAAEKQAALDLTDLISGKHMATAKQIVDNMDKEKLDILVKEQTPAFKIWVKSYNGSVEKATALYQKDKDAFAMVKLVSDPVALNISKALTYLVLFIVIFIVAMIFVRKIEGNMVASQRKKKSIRSIWSPILGAVCGIVVVMAFSIEMEWLVQAFCGATALLSKGVVTNGFIYPVIKLINPLRFLEMILP